MPKKVSPSERKMQVPIRFKYVARGVSAGFLNFEDYVVELENQLSIKKSQNKAQIELIESLQEQLKNKEAEASVKLDGDTQV